LTKTPYISFLDPDNEAVGNGYGTLLNAAKENKCDFAMGEIIKIGSQHSTTTLTSCYRSALLTESTALDLPTDSLQKVDFEAQSIQAVVIRTERLKSNELLMVDGVLGEDTFFFYQLLHASKRAVFLDTPIHIDYAGVQNSLTNQIKASFFERSLVCETQVFDWLKQIGSLEEYAKTRLPRYFTEWFFTRLVEIADEEEFIRSAKIMREYLKMFIETGLVEDKELLDIYSALKDEQWEKLLGY